MANTLLPPLDIVGPDGGSIAPRALDRGDTVGGLTGRLGAGSAERGSSAVVEVAVVAGPAASNWVAIPMGRHLIGRAAHARLHLDDPSVEPNHGLLLVEADGRIEIVQLSGAIPIRSEGRVLEPGTVLGLDDRITIGASTLRFRTPRPSSASVRTAHASDSVCAVTEPVGTIAAHPTDPWRRIVRRAPFRPSAWCPEPIVAPIAEKEPAPPALTGLFGVAVTAMSAVVLAQVRGNGVLMLFAAMGVAASLATFAVGTLTTRRKRSTFRAEHAQRVETFRRSVDQHRLTRRSHHGATNRSIVETHEEALGSGARIWQRRTEADDVVLRAVIGTGTHRWHPDVVVRDHAALDPSVLQCVEASARLDGVDAPISLRPGDAVALHGTSALARSVARSVIAQLATWFGPADWQLVVVSSDARAWRWVDRLPHGALAGSALIRAVGADVERLGDALDAVDSDRTTLLVTDEPQLFAARTGALRRFASASQAASIVVVDTDATVPPVCRRVLTVGSTGSASWTGAVPDEDDTVAITFAGVSHDVADEIARRLACLVDPEDDGASTSIRSATNRAD